MSQLFCFRARFDCKLCSFMVFPTYPARPCYSCKAPQHGGRSLFCTLRACLQGERVTLLLGLKSDLVQKQISQVALPYHPALMTCFFIVSYAAIVRPPLGEVRIPCRTAARAHFVVINKGVGQFYLSCDTT